MSIQPPESPSPAFLVDVVAYVRMFVRGGIACDYHGLDLQRTMVTKYPAPWMEWLYSEVGGRFPDDDE